MINKKPKHKHYINSLLTIIPIMIMMCSTVNASDLTVPNTFVANQPAIAAQVNANFSAVETSVDDNNTRLATLETLVAYMQATITVQQNTITQLQSDLSAVENNTVLELDGLLQYALIDGHDTAEFTKVNVQINDGSGNTDGSVNGKGNLIIGYHKTHSGAPYFCSNPQYIDSVNCIGNLHTWAQNVRTGSHNLILGDGHSYTKYSAIIAGLVNVSNSERASILSGYTNIAAGSSSIILGGDDNTTLGNASTVSGGRNNTASGASSTVSGGRINTASGTGSTISGGNNREVTGQFDWAAGSLFEDH